LVIFGMIIAMAATIQLYARKTQTDQEKLMAASGNRRIEFVVTQAKW